MKKNVAFIDQSIRTRRIFSFLFVFWLFRSCLPARLRPARDCGGARLPKKQRLKLVELLGRVVLLAAVVQSRLAVVIRLVVVAEK
jgi:hypothetical protein